MTTRRLNTRTEVEDFVHGLVFFGTGGGGGPAGPIIDRLFRQVEAGAHVGWTDIEDVPEDAWTFSVAGVGGRAPAEGPEPALLSRIGLAQYMYDDFRDMLLDAARNLVELHDVTPGAVIPVELGSGNTVTPLLVANELGVPLVDGDYCGRAKPEIQQSTLELEGRGVWPLVFVDRWGDVVHIPHAATTAMVDRIGRHLCSAAFGGVAVARALLPAKEARQSVVRNSLERALQVGRQLREARESRNNPVETIVDYLGGVHLFDGRLDRTDEDPESGYQFHLCTHYFSGIGGFSGQSCSVWVKNEHHIVWIDGTPKALSPDIIAVLDHRDGRPLTNHEISGAIDVSIVAAPPLDSRWRSEKGIELLGPRAFGFDIDFEPVESLASRS